MEDFFVVEKGKALSAAGTVNSARKDPDVWTTDVLVPEFCLPFWEG